MRTYSLICSFLLCAITLRASDNKSAERVYIEPYEKVWPVCLQVASEKWKVTHEDEAKGELTFRQGVSFKTNTWGIKVYVTVTRVDEDHTVVRLRPEKMIPTEISWARGEIVKKFFAAMDKQLVHPPVGMSPPSAVDPTSPR